MNEQMGRCIPSSPSASLSADDDDDDVDDDDDDDDGGGVYVASFNSAPIALWASMWGIAMSLHAHISNNNNKWSESAW